MRESEITHESKFEIWHQSNSFVISVFVIQLNPGELIRRRSLYGSVHAKLVNGNVFIPANADEEVPPWPSQRKEKLIWRRWDIGRARVKSYKVANLFRVAELTRSQLESGKEIKPTYERKWKEYAKRRTKREKKNDQRAQHADDG